MQRFLLQDHHSTLIDSTEMSCYYVLRTSESVYINTDQVFGMCHLLGFRFAPRLRDLGDRKLYTIEKTSSYPDLSLLIGGAVNVKQITDHWDELLRLTASLRLGTVTASLMLRKLASYPRQNGLAWALREM
jgi:TnpA family transposase